MDQDQDLSQVEEAQGLSSSQESGQSDQGSQAQDADYSEQPLDQHLESEQKEIEELDKAEETEEGEQKQGGEAAEAEGEDSADDESEDAEDPEAKGEYKANTKYKVLDEEHEFDPKLKKVLTKETEPIIRELYEKAHGIDAIKMSRTQAVRERDEVRGNYNNLVGEVGRILNYKKAGDLESFFESVQLDDDTVAKYILEKARIAQLPPDQQALYNERRLLRHRLNAVEQNFHTLQSSAESSGVQARISELDQVISDPQISKIASTFDARMGGKGAFRQAVMEHGAAKYLTTQKDLSPKDAVESFIKIAGISANTKKGPPKPGANVTKRVVARPKVQTIPNYSGSQASVTATKKPMSVDDLKRIRKEKYGA